MVLQKDGEDQFDRSCERNEEVLRIVSEEKNILKTIKKGKANWIGHILYRNCLLKHIIEGKIQEKTEVMGR